MMRHRSRFPLLESMVKERWEAERVGRVRCGRENKGGKKGMIRLIRTEEGFVSTCVFRCEKGREGEGRMESNAPPWNPPPGGAP